LSVSGLITVALSYTGGLQASAIRAARYISVISQIVYRSECAVIEMTREDGSATMDGDLVGHFTRCVLSVMRFRQQKWRNIAVISSLHVLRTCNSNAQFKMRRWVHAALCTP
jgi:hypothetical protein